MIEVLTSDLLPVRHGFFTRKGGASSGIFASLNCGPGSSDLAEAVAVNRARVAREMGVDDARLLSLHQIHSADVVTVSGPFAGDRPRADALVTATPGLALGILTADCQPVLFADSDARVVGAAHAGWRGAKAGILEAVILAMEALGADRRRIRVAIGPTIGPASYEVGPEFRDGFLIGSPATARFFAPGAGDRWLFDLPGYSLSRLRIAGVAKAGWTGHCTLSDPARFFSYRQSTRSGDADYGRMISVIRS